MDRNIKLMAVLAMGKERVSARSGRVGETSPRRWEISPSLFQEMER